jgi:hypothetical protein
VKKFILIALLVLIPFQFAWAGMSAYCQHEGGKSAMHFGHHAHQHAGAKETSDSKAKFGKVDLDCGSCHGVVAIFLTAVDSVAIPLGADSPEPRALLYTSHIPDGPRRPDRLPVA